jgi:hypothetical protein
MNLNDPRIDSYLNQELSEVDAQNFEREAKENPEVWDHIQFQQFMIQGIREEGAAELKDFIANRITEEVEDDFTSRNIWWSVAATLIILAVGLGVTYKFQWLDGDAKSVVAKNDVNQGSEKSALQKLEPQLSESDESKSKSATADTFLMPEIIADNEESSDAMVEAPMNEDVYASPLKDDARSDMGRQMDGLDKNKEIRSVNVAPFIVSAIELNSNPRSKVAVAESKAENSKPNAKRKMESSILSDTIAGYTGKSRVAQNAEGDEISSNSNSSPSFKKAKLEGTKQFLITLSEQSGITKPQVFMGGQANGKINLTLWNAGTSDILIFHLGDEYYLQLGNDFYYLPLIPGSTANLKPVADRAILEKLKQ